VTGPQVRIAAQAKLNLHLRVLAKEESGYHSIETIFHRIDLCDDIVIEITPRERTLDVEGTNLGPTESNLAWRAAAAYADHARWPSGFRIQLTKKIPVGAGLGGGSADAAAILRALNSISPNPIGLPGLLHLADTIGSDVPFLASSSVMALAWSRGERMVSLPPLQRCDVLLMTPEFSVSTADAYRWLDEDRARDMGARRMMDESNDMTDSLVIDTDDLSTWASIARFAHNDFETAVVTRYPRMLEYLDRVRRFRPILSQMTGSGSTVFGVLDGPPDYSGVPEDDRARMTTTSTSIDVVQPVRVG
jgi:4-diphosphocytidyl-2-C-methyl-D-erythritol kinase